MGIPGLRVRVGVGRPAQAATGLVEASVDDVLVGVAIDPAGKLTDPSGQPHDSAPEDPIHHVGKTRERITQATQRGSIELIAAEPVRQGGEESGRFTGEGILSGSGFSRLATVNRPAGADTDRHEHDREAHQPGSLGQ